MAKPESDHQLTSDGDQIRIADFDNVIAGQGFRVEFLRISHERAKTGPSAQNVTSTNYKQTRLGIRQPR